MNFGQVLTAMVTPFDNELNVDFEQAEKLAERLLANGSDGLVVAATTGEGATLTVEERRELWKRVKNVVGNRGKVIAGAGNNCTRESLELTQVAEEAGVDGLLLVVPYYNNPPQEGLYQHFKTVAQSSDLPVILYNVPGRTVRNLDAETTLRLAYDVPNIVGIKEAGKSIEQVLEVCQNRPKGFQVYSGDDAATLAFLSMGADGVISVVSHCVGNELKAMVQAFIAGDVKKAAEIDGKLLPMFKALFCTTNPIPVKAALNIMGVHVGGVRLPLVEANEAQTELLRNCLKEYNLLSA